MAEISFHVNYYFVLDGEDESGGGEEFSPTLVQKFEDGVSLSFGDSSFEADYVDVVEVDTWSDIPEEFQAQGCDAVADLYVTFTVDDDLVDNLELDSEADEYTEDVDVVLGKGVYRVEGELPISRPYAIQVFG
jgi:hypothetical protein